MLTLENTPAGKANSGQPKTKMNVRMRLQVQICFSAWLSACVVSSSAIFTFCMQRDRQHLEILLQVQRVDAARQDGFQF